MGFQSLGRAAQRSSSIRSSTQGKACRTADRCLPLREARQRPCLIATWYELMPDGKRRKRSKGYSYGTPRALYDSSEKAKSAAIERRNREETRWYCTTGAGTDRTPNPL